ncbi:MAG TPA: hypothetical protein VKT32_15540 [Chthonomonadaceae bacterium]|nr:hypothetical protein [Chthonomonadaceae bacterium]
MHRRRQHPQAWEEIAVGRGALARHGADTVGEALRIREEGPAARLLAHLWHEDLAVRRAAALALPGGDHQIAYAPNYGHFAGVFLRAVASHSHRAPEGAADRYATVARSLGALLEQNASDIRAMSNMSYSFLSSALYVALFATCRDTLEAVRRLRASSAHPELCRLLWSLSRLSLSTRINGADVDALGQMAARTLAALPPDEVPEFWRSLMHPSPPRRMAVAPVLAHLEDRRAVPYLAKALLGQPPNLAQPLIAALRRMEDLRAVPALAETARSSPLLRGPARAAIAAIERANAGSPPRTLLRPAETRAGLPVEQMLRPVPHAGAQESPALLLRVENEREKEGAGRP